MPLQEEYVVSLDAFHGPLDLLLYLIRRAEVDVHDIPIAKITDQYVAFLGQIEEIDVELAGEFLVLAATLVEIKSRLLMPAPADGESDGAPVAAPNAAPLDPRFELVQQLLAYQRFRIAAESLETRRQEFLNRFALRPARQIREAAPPEPVELELDDVHALDLSEHYERIMSSIDLARLGDHRVEIDDTPIELHEEDLLDRLERSPSRRLTLQETFDGRNPGERIGLFLATLELTRMRRIRVRQDEVTDPILVELNDDESDVLVIETDAINRHVANAEPATTSDPETESTAPEA
ncbi:MAG: segregation and condensation protein A [Planctomycetota bacterium]|jgi:segregation and condensation protein A